MTSMEALLPKIGKSVLIFSISYYSTQCILNSHWSLSQMTAHRGCSKEYAKCGTQPNKVQQLPSKGVRIC